MNSRVLTDYSHRFRSWLEEDLTIWSGIRCGIGVVLSILIDLSIFLFFLSMGMNPGKSHILSFLPGTSFNYAWNLRWVRAPGQGGEAVRPAEWLFFPFLIVALMVLFLRGGVLVTFTHLLGWRPQLAILPAIVIAVTVLYLGNIFFAPLWVNHLECERRWEMLALGAVGYMLLLRLFYLGGPELLPQEAYYWNYAQHLDIGYLDHPPMVAWVIWLGTTLLGDTEFAVRLGAFFSWFATAFFCFRLTHNLFDKSAAFRALLLLAILPFFYGVGLIMTPDALLVACWAGTLYFLERALLGERRLAWWGVGVCAGLGMLSKYTIALLAPAALLFMVMDRHSRRWLLRPEPYAAILLALLLFMPVIIWNAEHQWSSFIFQGPHRFQGPLNFRLPALIGSVLLLLTPTGAMAALAVLPSKARRGTEREGETVNGEGRRRLFVALLTLFPFLFFLSFSLFWRVKLNWTGPIWLAALPFMASQMTSAEALLPSRLGKFLRRAWPPTMVATVLFLGAFLYFWVLGLPGIPYPQGKNVAPLLGWKDLAQRIAQVEEEVEASTKMQALVVGMDKSFIASELAFYLHQLNHGEGAEQAVSFTTGRHLFGGESLMYRFWFPESRIKKLQRENPVLILVTRELHELKDDRIQSHGWEIGTVKDIAIRKNGVIVGYYHYALATRLRGLPAGVGG